MAVADDKDIEEGPLLGNEAKPVAAADSRRVLGLPVHVVSGAAYCVASASMVLLNKAALSSFDFNSTTSLLFFQCLVCVILVKLADLLGLVTLEPWNMKIIQVRTFCCKGLWALPTVHVTLIAATADVVSSQSNICWHDLDQFLCTEEPWGANVNSAEELDQLVCDWWRLLLLWQKLWQCCLADSCFDDDLSSLWCCHRLGFQPDRISLAAGQLLLHCSILFVFAGSHGQASRHDCEQNTSG